MQRALLSIALLSFASSCNTLRGAKVDGVSLKRAIQDSVIVAHETKASSLTMEFSVAYEVGAGADGTAFAVPVSVAGKTSAGTKATFVLKDVAAIKAAHTDVLNNRAPLERAKIDLRTGEAKAY